MNSKENILKGYDRIFYIKNLRLFEKALAPIIDELKKICRQSVDRNGDFDNKHLWSREELEYQAGLIVIQIMTLETTHFKISKTFFELSLDLREDWSASISSDYFAEFSQQIAFIIVKVLLIHDGLVEDSGEI